MRVAAFLAGVVAVSCYGPTFKVGVPCSSDGVCPPGQHCNFRLDPPTCEAGDARPIDAPPDTPDYCAGPADCDMGTPVCDLTTSFCRGCIADTECGVDVCLEQAGTCHNASNSLFIAPAGTGTACTRASPCTLSTAIAQAANNQKVIVVLDGTYGTTFTIPSNFLPNSLTLSGEDRDPAGVVITPSAGAGITVAASSKAIVIEGITVATAPANGVDNAGTLTLSHVLIRDAGGVGVSSTSNSLTLIDSEVQNAATIGVTVTGGTVAIQRSYIHGHAEGGLSIDGAAYTVENTFIVTNGLSTSAFGGVRIANVGALAPQVFQFNTVANNMAVLTSEAGVQCPTTLTIDSSIITEAVGCPTQFSLTMGTDPMFVSTTDFHLQPTSPAIDMANPDATITTDIDGQFRAGARDIGADELGP